MSKKKKLKTKKIELKDLSFTGGRVAINTLFKAPKSSEDPPVYISGTNYRKPVYIKNAITGTLYGISNSILISHCKFKELEIHNSILSRVCFINCSFEQLTICNSTLSQCLFQGCTVDNFTVRSTSFVSSKIQGCSLKNMYFALSHMYGGNFSENTIRPRQLCLKFQLSFNQTKVGHNPSIFADFPNDGTELVNLTQILPSHGSFIGWKHAWRYNSKDCRIPSKDRRTPVIVKLLIPETAQRSNASGRKCRCSEAKVLGIFDILANGNLKEIGEVAHSDWNVNFTYRKGQLVKPTNPFSIDKMSECDSGIHFFITLQEALDYKSSFA